MPPAQDDNPFGTPRGAWGRQPPTTFSLSTPVKRPVRPSNQIRVPAPSLAPRNVLTGGLVPRPSPAPSPPSPPPAPEGPVPAVEPPTPILVSVPDPVGARSAPKGRGRGLPFPPVAGIGVLIAAIVVAGLMLLRREPPAPELAAVAPPQAPAPLPDQPASAAIAEPAVAPPLTTIVRTIRTESAPVTRPAAAPEAPAPITPPPLAVPPVVAAPPAPAPAVPPPTDPDIPMTTRLPGPQ